jgi:glycosyltransferase involved in cell wall biosynthesis
MNIGIFIQAYLPKIGGAQLSTHCLANKMVQEGHTVTIFTELALVKACKINNWNFDYNLVGVNLPRNRLLKIFYPLWRHLLTRIVKKQTEIYALDVVQIINAWPWIAMDFHHLDFSLPIVLRAVGDDIQIDKALNYGMRQDENISSIVKDGYSHIFCAIANSDTTVSEYKKMGLPDSKIAKVTPGVDNHLFAKQFPGRDVVRSEYGVPKLSKILIAVGRNHQKKGYSDLIRALEYLNQDQDQFCVVIVGKNTKQLIPIAEGIGQAKNFFPIEEISASETGVLTTFPSIKLIELYKASDYFILPSILETFGNVKLEAMAAGLPVIVTDAPGARDAITDRKTGLIVPVRSPQSIASAVERLESDPSLKAHLIENGFFMAKEQDWANVAKEYLSVYESLLSL